LFLIDHYSVGQTQKYPEYNEKEKESEICLSWA
jgi:hypothetical protein